MTAAVYLRSGAAQALHRRDGSLQSLQRRILLFSRRFYTGSPYRFFIGLRRINNNNNNDAFQWIDGSLLSSGSGYSDWRSEEPNNQATGEDCVTIGFERSLDPAYNWVDVPCSSGQYRYICERNITGEQQRLLIIGSMKLWFEPVVV